MQSWMYINYEYFACICTWILFIEDDEILKEIILKYAMIHTQFVVVIGLCPIILGYIL